jgi:hypothetical protein
MASKVKVERFDKTDKSKMRLRGNVTRTGASTAGKTRAHGNHHKHR